MPKRHYVLALACYLAIPVVIVAGGGLFRLIDPEMARGHADYVRDYRLLEFARTGALMAMSGLAVVLWISTCYLVVASRQRSKGWVALAAAGPFGLIAITMLSDRSPAVDDRHQHLVHRMKMRRRVPLEIAVFACVWTFAYQFIVVKRELMIGYEAFSTGTARAAIVAQQTASSGMWAFGEGLEMIYVVGLIYLLLPILFNAAAQRLRSSAKSIQKAE